jgi:hypothetical protein
MFPGTGVLPAPADTLLSPCAAAAAGEFGSRFENPEDLAHLADLALYMNAQGAGNTGGHK